MFLVKLKKQPKKKELCVTEKNKRFNPKFFFGVLGANAPRRRGDVRPHSGLKSGEYFPLLKKANFLHIP